MENMNYKLNQAVVDATKEMFQLIMNEDIFVKSINSPTCFPVRQVDFYKS